MQNLNLSDDLYKIESRIVFSLFDRKTKSGRLRFIESTYSENTLTTNGHIQIADQMAHRKLSPMRYMAIGDVSGGKVAGSNVLENELARVYMANWDNAGTNALVYDAYFIEGVGTSLINGIQEAGILNDQLAGNMLSWSDFAPIIKTVLNILRIQWTHNY